MSNTGDVTNGFGAPASMVRAKRPWWNIFLLAATLVTTTIAGAAHQGFSVLRHPGAWRAGPPYGLALMLILGVHEMGHYLAARRHRVSASLPYFIPVPFGLGTFGAFISMSGEMRTRRQLFDIGVAGPLAGLAMAIPALLIGLRWSSVIPSGGATAGFFGHGVDVHSSLVLAGAAMVVLALFVWSDLLFWAAFVFAVGGTRGIGAQDDVTPLDGQRRALAWA